MTIPEELYYGNTAPLPTKSPPTTVSETIITEKTSSITAVEPTEKEKEPVPTESKNQATEPTVAATEPTITVEPAEETKPTETERATVTNTAEEKVTPPIKETALNITPQLAENETTETEPPKGSSLFVVRMTGFEPAASCSQSKRSTKLSHIRICLQQSVLYRTETKNATENSVLLGK